MSDSTNPETATPAASTATKRRSPGPWNVKRAAAAIAERQTGINSLANRLKETGEEAFISIGATLADACATLDEALEPMPETALIRRKGSEVSFQVGDVVEISDKHLADYQATYGADVVAMRLTVEKIANGRPLVKAEGWGYFGFQPTTHFKHALAPAAAAE